MKAPLAWGFSLERTRTYVDKALALKLDEHPQWLRLGHYQKSWTGSYLSKIQGVFFLAADGAKNPRAELRATIETLFSADGLSQCRYLARAKWLRSQLKIVSEDIIACPERDAWKTRLGAEEAYFVFASSDLNSAASSFGHTFLRLHNPKNVSHLDLIDYGINFAAQTREDDGILFGLKGLFGMYPGSYSMMPYHQKLRDYINLEGRDIWEYKTNLSKAEVEMMIDHLIELEGSYVSYYFIDDNCSYAILELLEVVRPSLKLTSHFVDATIPIDTLKVLNAQTGFLTGERRRPALRSDFQKIYEHLNSGQKDRLVSLVEQVKSQPKSEAVGETDALVLEAALGYLAIEEYRDQRDYKEWKHQISKARARLGPVDEIVNPVLSSPLASPRSSAFYFGYGQLDQRSIARVKFRRAFHDLISRDDGLNPFSHVEVLSADFQYEFDARRLDLDNFTLLKIISTSPVTRLDRPLTWKTSIGTEPKLSPFLEGGAGLSFDFNIGESSRWINLFVGRIYEREGRFRAGTGAESLLVQKLSSRLRMFEGIKFLGVVDEKPIFEANVAVSYDLTPKIESRLSFERKFENDLWLINLIF